MAAEDFFDPVDVQDFHSAAEDEDEDEAWTPHQSQPAAAAAARS